MLAHADTIGIFQIESRAQMSMLPRLKPTCFYDLVIEVAIVRPGPIQGNMVHPYLRRRNGEEAVTYPSEAMRQVLEKTLGVPLFQEQAMRVAMVGAGFSAAEADQLRRAMAAWRKSAKLETFRQKIVDGMLANGYTQGFAEQCYLQIRGFGEYGFPESHAASFALLVYASAWLKCYYPAEFAAALINSQPMGFYAPAQIVRDAQNHGVEVRPVDVNESEWDCTLEGSPEELPVASCQLPVLRLGFRIVKGLRQEEMERLVSTRKRAGRFTSVADVHETTGLSKATLRKLAEADAFGSLGLTRRQAMWRVLEVDDRQWPLFADVGSASADAEARSRPLKRTLQTDTQQNAADFLPAMPLGREVMTDYSTTGLSLKRHPVELIREQLRAMRILTAKEIADLPHGTKAKAAGIVLIRQRPGTASGIVFVTIEDETGIVNLIIRPNIFDRDRQPARHADLLQAEGRIERQGEVVHLVATRLADQSPLLSGHEFRSRDFH
jgi:error-prone DNA polymerase